MRLSMRSPMVAVAMLAAVTAARAGGFGVPEQTAYGQGSSYAGMAAPGDSISSMFWNPAAVTTADGITLEGNATVISVQSRLSVDPNRSTLAGYGITGNGGDVGEISLVPGTYFAAPINDRLSFGVSMTSPFGQLTTSSTPYVGMFSHLDTDVRSIDVTPVLGIKVNDRLSLGIGMQVLYLYSDIETAMAPTASPPRQMIKGDDFGYGFVAGLTFTPREGTTIGIGYRSPVKMSLDETQSYGIPVVTPFGIIPKGVYPVTADLTLPETVSVGIRQKINGRLSLSAGMQWTNWSRIQTVQLVGSPTDTSLVFGYGDGWFFSVGGEYQYNPDLTLRAGIGYEIAPTKDQYRSIRGADSNHVWTSVGASYRWNKRLTLDAAYSHLFVADAPIDETTSGVRYAGTAKGSVDMISVGLRYRFGI